MDFGCAGVALEARRWWAPPPRNRLLWVLKPSPPEGGTVTASVDWDGAPYDYVAASFASCNARSATCARFERFDAPLRNGGLSEWRRVGYDIDPTVRHIRVRLVLAADLVNSR